MAAGTPPLSQILGLLPHAVALLPHADPAEGIAVVLLLVGRGELFVGDGEGGCGWELERTGEFYLVEVASIAIF